VPARRRDQFAGLRAGADMQVVGAFTMRAVVSSDMVAELWSRRTRPATLTTLVARPPEDRRDGGGGAEIEVADADRDGLRHRELAETGGADDQCAGRPGVATPRRRTVTEEPRRTQ